MYFDETGGLSAVSRNCGPVSRMEGCSPKPWAKNLAVEKVPD